MILSSTGGNTCAPRSVRLDLKAHDPTTPSRQGNDRGTSYRSAIFYTSEEQRRVAEDTIADVEASGLWPGKVVTELSPAGRFLGGGARAPGLPGTLPERLPLPLRPPAVEVAAAIPVKLQQFLSSFVVPSRR